MWNVETTVIPVLIGVTKTISKSFTKYLESKILRNYRKQLYLILCKYFGKY